LTKRYNSTIKLALKLQSRTEKKIIEQFLGKFSIWNMIQISYLSNAKKIIEELNPHLKAGSEISKQALVNMQLNCEELNHSLGIEDN